MLGETHNVTRSRAMQERTAVVTGGTSGIGAAIVQTLTDAGWRVISLSRRNTVDTPTFAASASVVHCPVDLTTPQGVQQACEVVRIHVEQLHLLVNCAGSIAPEERIAHVAYAEVERSLRLHALAPMFLTQGLADLLRQAGGSVVHIGSVYDEIADTDVAGYALAKAVLPQLTRMQARELAPRVRVNLVRPGHIDTPMTRAAPADYLAAVAAKTPLGTLGRAADVAQAVMFLASEGARFITGAELRVDGGYLTNAGLAS